MISKIIFSVFQNDASEDANWINTIFIEKQLKTCGIEFKTLEGVYKGTKEGSFAIHTRHINAALEIAMKYSQESILLVDGEGKATLKYLPISTQENVDLGYFVETTEHVAKTHDSYTYDLDTGTYYICVHNRRSNDRISFNTITWGIND